MTDAQAKPTVHELPPENVGRGLLFSLAVIPVGVILWVVVWSLGFIAAIIAALVSIGAVWLYRKGSGGRVSFVGVIVVAVVTLVTLVIAFLGGLVADYAAAIAAEIGGTQLDALAYPDFWTFFGLDLPAMLEGNGLNLLLALGFGVLGAFGTLRAVFAEAKAAPAAAYSFPLAQEAPAEPAAQFGTAPAVTPDLNAIPAYEVPPAAAVPAVEPTAPPTPETDPRV
ncbi:hypothetical protein EYE40_11075 [Glaciihabitans arcticus]|uniref:Uncharacterized protein n=1 Tax=Glaciihabitans arcticus TaxID=2668039 RepID=A0A4Q9GT63_9MICO|nr:hypothetical protein [Glaciihabitans arcticus]TBN57891.1 hypothetical protein EYE40_11075 [Glaciihabitans arcticus]